jgi:hypothetical protein
MKIFGISGVARSGKDKFADLAIQFFESKGIKAQKFALANQLKIDLHDFVFKNFGFSIFSASPQQKELIRPLMVAYGCAMRAKSNGTHWYNLLENQIRESAADIAIVTDVRFAEYEKDEVWWVTKHLKSKLIHLTRYDSSGNVVLPPNAEETINDCKIQNVADYHVKWKTDEAKCPEITFKFLEEYPEIWN